MSLLKSQIGEKDFLLNETNARVSHLENEVSSLSEQKKSFEDQIAQLTSKIDKLKYQNANLRKDTHKSQDFEDMLEKKDKMINKI